MAFFLAHELGHALGLLHTYQPDELSDTYTPDSYSWCDCSTNNCSNNIMGASNNRNFYSPRQMGKMRRLLTVGWRSKVLDNSLLNNSDITISSNTIWNLPRVVDANVIVDNSSLSTQCNVSMPISKGFTVKNGGVLTVNSCNLLNNCGNNWNGITVKSGGLLVLDATNISDYSVIVESGGTVVVKTSLSISGTHNITIQSGGYICIENGTIVLLNDLYSQIKINEGALYGVNPSLSVQSNCIALPASIIPTGNGSIVDYNQDVYIQNETISASQYIGGRNIYVGNHVTTTKTQGNVLINDGANVIFDCKTIIFDAGFESAGGSSYEVMNH